MHQLPKFCMYVSRERDQVPALNAGVTCVLAGAAKRVAAGNAAGGCPFA